MKKHVYTCALAFLTIAVSTILQSTENASKIKSQSQSLSRPPAKTIKGTERTKKVPLLKKTSQKPITPQPPSTPILNEDSSYEDIVAYLEQSIHEADSHIKALQKREKTDPLINSFLVKQSFRQSIKNALQTMNLKNVPEKEWSTILIVFINNIINIAKLLQIIMQTQPSLDNNDRYAIAKLKDHPLLQQQDQLRHIPLQLRNEFQNACTIIHNAVPEFPLLTPFLPPKPKPVIKEEPQEKQVIEPEKIIHEQPQSSTMQQFPFSEEKQQEFEKKMEETRQQIKARFEEARQKREEREQERIERKTQEENSWEIRLRTNLNPFYWIDRILPIILTPILDFVSYVYNWITSKPQY